jgi:hypothetical protein
MTEEQAIEELMFHSGRHTDVHNDRWTNGFLGMLRPFNGYLIEENFHKIVASLVILSNKLNEDSIKNEIIASIWGICHLGRAWAVYPEGMLQSNNLIKAEQVKQIEHWIEHISYITFCLLDGCEEIVAFEYYETEYNSQNSN